jgi:GxxExxY protein
MIHHEGTKGTKGMKVIGLGVSQAVIGAAIEVHRHLGPGLLESLYEAALCRELWLRGLKVERQVPVRVSYKGVELGNQVRLDLLVNSVVVVEVKSVGALARSTEPNSSHTSSSPAIPWGCYSISMSNSSRTECDASSTAEETFVSFVPSW